VSAIMPLFQDVSTVVKTLYGNGECFQGKMPLIVCYGYGGHF